MGDTKGSGSVPKPGSAEWKAAIEEHDAQAKASDNPNQTFEIAQPQEDGRATLTVRAFGLWLRSAWVADLRSEPEPAMSGLTSLADRGVLVGGVA